MIAEIVAGFLGIAIALLWLRFILFVHRIARDTINERDAYIASVKRRKEK